MAVGLDLPDGTDPAHEAVRLRITPRSARSPAVDTAADATLLPVPDSYDDKGCQQGLGRV